MRGALPCLSSFRETTRRRPRRAATQGEEHRDWNTPESCDVVSAIHKYNELNSSLEHGQVSVKGKGHDKKYFLTIFDRMDTVTVPLDRLAVTNWFEAEMRRPG